MYLTIETEQKKFFHRQGWLELEGLLQEDEQKELLKEFEQIISSYPGNRFERGLYISRSIPLLKQLNRRHGWGNLAFELTSQKPLHLVYDHAFQNLSSDQRKMFNSHFLQPGSVCALVLFLGGDRSGHGIFVLPRGFEHLTFLPDQWYLFMLFSKQPLQDPFYPQIT